MIGDMNNWNDKEIGCIIISINIINTYVYILLNPHVFSMVESWAPNIY